MLNECCLDFLANLVLWVDHKRPAVSLAHQDPILSRHSVTRQTLCVPLADDKWVTQNVDQAETGTDGDVQFLALYYPLFNELGKRECTQTHASVFFLGCFFVCFFKDDCIRFILHIL